MPSVPVWVDPRTWSWTALLVHPLFVALAQLLIDAFIAYVLTEKWQRWRQRRESQHHTLVKFSELTYELTDLLAELLMLRGKMAPEIYITKNRELVSRWTALAATRGEVMAAYGRPLVLDAHYQGVFNTLKTLRAYVREPAPVLRTRFEPEQEKFLAHREAVVAHMVRAMGLLSTREWKTEVNRARVRIDAAEAAATRSTPGKPGAPDGPDAT